MLRCFSDLLEVGSRFRSTVGKMQLKQYNLFYAAYTITILHVISTMVWTRKALNQVILKWAALQEVLALKIRTVRARTVNAMAWEM